MTRAVLICLAALSLPACGGCGDDTAADPDAEPQQAPDAEVPDATPDLPPGPVTDLTAAPDDPAEIDLTWTNPGDADLAGLLVVVSSAAITFTPTDGTTYSAAQDLGGGQSVLSVGAAASATLASATIGARYHFSVWAFDDATQYSTAATTTGAHDALGAQTATISISLAGVVTVTSAPPSFTLSGTAVYTDANDTLDVDLTVQNDAARLIFNLKALTTAQNEGTQAGNTFPLTGGQPSTYYGPDALDVGASATRTLALEGITGATDPITVTLSFVDAPMLFLGHYNGFISADTSGSGATSNDDVLSASRCGALSLDGRFLYFGSKDAPALSTLDTTTTTVVTGTTLGDAANGLGAIGGLARSPDGAHLYALLTDGAHYHAGDANGTGGRGTSPVADTEVQVVELNASDLSEARRLTLVTGDTTLLTGVSLAINPDGTKLAAVLSTSFGTPLNQLWLIDVASLATIHTVDLSAQGMAYRAIWSQGSVYVGFNNASYWVNGDDTAAGLDVVDATTFAVTPIPAPTGAGAVAQPMAALGDKVYYASGDRDGSPTVGFHVIQGTTVTPLAAIVESRGVALDPSGTRYYVVNDNETVTVVETATDTPIDTDGDATNGVTPFPLVFRGAGFAIVTPF